MKHKPQRKRCIFFFFSLSQEERIRRAEEIYYRRKLNNSDVRMPSSQVRDKTEKRQFSLYRKMAIQILLCVLIYLVFSLIKEAITRVTIPMSMRVIIIVPIVYLLIITMP